MVNLSREDPYNLSYAPRSRVICPKGSTGSDPVLCLSVIISTACHIKTPAPIRGAQSYGNRYLSGILIDGEGQRLFNAVGLLFGVGTIGVQMTNGALEFGTSAPLEVLNKNISKSGFVFAAFLIIF